MQHNSSKVCLYHISCHNVRRDKPYCSFNIKSRFLNDFLALGLTIESNLIHNPLGPHFAHFVCSNIMGCEYNSLVKSLVTSRQETIYHSIIELYISEFTSRASVPPISCLLLLLYLEGRRQRR